MLETPEGWGRREEGYKNNGVIIKLGRAGVKWLVQRGGFINSEVSLLLQPEQNLKSRRTRRTAAEGAEKIREVEERRTYLRG